MTITSETDISIARMLMNLESMEMVDKDGQKIPVLTNISIPSVTAADGDDGSTVYNFSVSAQYYQVVQAMVQEAANALTRAHRHPQARQTRKYEQEEKRYGYKKENVKS